MEKSNKRSREDRDRDHHKHRSRESDDKRSSRLDDTDRHRHHHHRDSSSSKREKSYDSREDRESSRDRERSRSVDLRDDREGSRDRSRDDNRTKHRDSSRRDRAYDLRDEREGSRDRDERRREKSYELRGEREDSIERDDRVGHREASKRERSYHSREEREESRERDDRMKYREGSKRERSYGEGEKERSEVDRRSKRKEREKSEEEEEDRGIDEDRRRKRKLEDANGSYKAEEKRERRKFEDKVKEEDGRGEEESGEKKREKRERRRFGDKAKEDDGRVEEDGDAGKLRSANAVNGGGGVTAVNGVTPEPSAMTLRTVPDSTPSHHFPTKVSSISNTNENKGVSITGSHEVPGKTSTDGTSTAAGKSASLSLDALTKAKKALQMQRELSEKLKKIPLLNKSASSIADGSKPTGPNEGAIASSATTSKPFSPGTTPSTSNLPTAAPTVNPPSAGVPSASGLPDVPKYEAVKRAQELAAKMGFRQDPQFAPLINLFPGQVAADMAIPQKPTKAPVLRLDAFGREIDEHGNVVNFTKPSNLSTLKVNINKQKKEAFQILKPELDVDPESNPHFDPRMGINKTKLLRPKKMSFLFVEEGKWSKEAEMMKLKSQFGEARAKEQKAKQAQLAKAKSAPDINPNLIEVSERVLVKEKQKETIPEVEWWDVPLLHSGNYEGVIDGVIPDDKLKMDKITIYVEHPRPIEPPSEPAPPPPQPLKLTKKEQKKLRTQRRLATEKDKQELIRQGLIEPPKPKVKMSNLMKVLGSEATQDPTRLEREIRTAAAEREQAHVDRNIARKLTPAERREKKERKLFDDPNTLETIVSVYRINDLSHKQTRFKVDVNAQENRLTGCAVLSDGINVVVVEGGSKSIKRYSKLMRRRINWASAVNDDEDEEDENEDKPPNKCVLVWQGSVAKPSFNRFTVHECITEAAARKVFSDAGVGHFWDLAVNFADDQV